MFSHSASEPLGEQTTGAEANGGHYCAADKLAEPGKAARNSPLIPLPSSQETSHLAATLPACQGLRIGVLYAVRCCE